MKKILIKCYNNSDWLSDTDFIILNISNETIKEIKNIQDRLNKCFPIEHAEVHLYNQDFEVYSYDSILSNKIIDFMEPDNDMKLSEYLILENNDIDYNSLIKSETINDVRLSTYMLKVYKNIIRCICYPKYDGSIEIYSDEININEL
jgi:hypothetical protein